MVTEASVNEQWLQFLREAGASVEDGTVRSFQGDIGLDHARSGSFICDLSAASLLAFTGPDAETFLHAQLSSDVKSLGEDRAQLSTYNTPKGRILATLLLWRTDGGFLAQLPTSIAAGVLKRLSMFILRSRVKASDASERFIRLGVGGPAAREVLTAAGIATPEEALAVTRVPLHAGAMQPELVLALPGERFELLCPDFDSARAVWSAVRGRGAHPAGTAPWQWLAVQSGIAEIGPETQDRFVPQMLNLEQAGAVSFTKGCYPGQEIVARTQYRGEIKRRTRLAHLDAIVAPLPGQDIVDARAAAQAIGSLVAVAPAPEGGYDVLACLHLELAAGAELRLGAADGPRLRLVELPRAFTAAV